MIAVAQRWHIGGRVQGVGYRPFIYRLACDFQVSGWVRNNSGAVEIHGEGLPDRLQAFEAALFLKPPPTASARLLARTSVAVESSVGFRILPSGLESGDDTSIPVDLFTCEDCLAELRDPAARRFRYPFVNCTQCGPRYTIIRDLPYDRCNTTLDCFPLCAACRSEYSQPSDRRFHAQPLACPECGPQLYFDGEARIDGNERAMKAAVVCLRDGGILALRGVGGYHLLCDATNEAAVASLRARKGRPEKPFAVLLPWRGHDGLEAADEIVRLSAIEAAALTSAVRPIVLARRRSSAVLAGGIAPGLNEIGVMLPYSPLHHLLTDDFAGALVATSGNLSGEPVLTDTNEARQRLGGMADGFLHHTRGITRPADDPVVRLAAGAMRAVRLGRGSAPLEFRLQSKISVPTLALGAYSKATVALAWSDRVVVSPHIGNLSTPRGRAVLMQVADDLQRLYGIRAARVAHDAHPGFPTTQWAQASGMPTLPVWHHHAHAAAVAGEYPGALPLMCFTWDGIGLGPDGTLWGGEALIGLPGQWRRAASFRPFRLPGGEHAARQPWRSGLALSWETGRPWPGGESFDPGLLRAAFDRDLNAPLTTSVGRLFDAASAYVGVRFTATYEGEGAMRLEALCKDLGEPVHLPLSRDDAGVWRSDWEALLPVLLDGGRSAAERAAVFHATLAQAIHAQAVAVRDDTGVRRVGLSGGVFQNRRLIERALGLLQAAGFEVCIPAQIPINDAAISFGQIIETASIHV
jgi:hydrogenase maturation protein HypF